MRKFTTKLLNISLVSSPNCISRSQGFSAFSRAFHERLSCNVYGEQIDFHMFATLVISKSHPLYNMQLVAKVFSILMKFKVGKTNNDALTAVSCFFALPSSWKRSSEVSVLIEWTFSSVSTKLMKKNRRQVNSRKSAMCRLFPLANP